MSVFAKFSSIVHSADGDRWHHSHYKVLDWNPDIIYRPVLVSDHPWYVTSEYIQHSNDIIIVQCPYVRGIIYHLHPLNVGNSYTAHSHTTPHTLSQQNRQTAQTPYFFLITSVCALSVLFTLLLIIDCRGHKWLKWHKCLIYMLHTNNDTLVVWLSTNGTNHLPGCW